MRFAPLQLAERATAGGGLLLAALALVSCGDGGALPGSQGTARAGADEATARPEAATPPGSSSASPGPAPRTATPTPEPAPRAITFAAVGDLMLGRSVAATITEADPAGPFAHVREALETADVTVGNLEGAITGRGAAEPKAYVFRAPPLAARGLALAGFDAVALANNHAMDFGHTGLTDTIALLEAEGILAAGAGASPERAYAAVYLERAGRRIAFLSFAEVPAEAGYDVRDWTAVDGRPGIAWLDNATMADAVAGAASSADIVVVFFHFGYEGWSSPSERQESVARAAVDAGATMVLGSHPHLVQRVEEYGGGLIAYSLGNFVFDGFDGVFNRSAILRVTIEPGGGISWDLYPVAIGGDGRPRPVP